MEINNANIFQRLNGAAGADSANALDILGLSQDGVANSQNDFSKLLEQLGAGQEGLQNLLGEGLENPEQVLELIENFPKDIKLNFLEELKTDLPALLENIKTESNAISELGFSPKEIAGKVQEIIDLVKEGGEKVSDAFKSVFDGGIFNKIFGEGEKVNPKLLSSLESNLKKMSAQEPMVAENKVSSSDDVLELHNFRKNQQANQALNKNIKNFSQFNKQQGLIKSAEVNANNIASQVNADSNVLEMKKMFKQGMKNPYAQNTDSSMIKMNQVEPTQMTKDNGSQDFMGQGQQQNQTLAAILGQGPSQSSEAINQDSVFMNNADKTAALDLNKMIDGSSNKVELIKNVTNYLEQVQFSNQKELDVAVKHAELGDFNIQVSKDIKTNNLDLQIKAMTDEGVNFFQDNEVELMKTLNDKGIKLASLKIGSKGEGSMSLGLDKQDSSGTNQQSKDGQSQSFAQQQRQQQGKDSGHDRRRELWQRYQEQMAS